MIIDHAHDHVPVNPLTGVEAFINHGCNAMVVQRSTIRLTWRRARLLAVDLVTRLYAVSEARVNLFTVDMPTASLFTVGLRAVVNARICVPRANTRMNAAPGA